MISIIETLKRCTPSATAAQFQSHVKEFATTAVVLQGDWRPCA